MKARIALKRQYQHCNEDTEPWYGGGGGGGEGLNARFLD